MRRALLISVLGLVGVASCVFRARNDPGGDGGEGGTFPPAGTGGYTRPGVDGGGGGVGTTCKNLQCQQGTCTGNGCKVPPCQGGATTKVKGKVYDPAGKVPLYNVAVYVPNAELKPINDGAECVPCTPLTGDPIVLEYQNGTPINHVQTDSTGSFELNNVPVGENIPLVMQVGKWRRQITLPKVEACGTLDLSDPAQYANLTRLPRTRDEGNIPKIALTTGGADALECLLRKIGVADTEFTPEASPGRVNLFAGGTHGGMYMGGNMTSPGTNAYDASLNGGAKFTDAEVWWETLDNLKKYDIVLHSCEGVANPTNKSDAAKQALLGYMNLGGRVFLSHWHNNWIERGPAPLPTTAEFDHLNDPPNPFTTLIDTGPAKGKALRDWLVNVGASTTPGQLIIKGAKQTVKTANPATSTRWIYSDPMTVTTPSGVMRNIPASVQYYSFTTPVGAEMGKQCGKTVFSDLHVSSGTGMAGEDDSDKSKPFPTGCVTTELSPQEKALEFMLFDLGACVTGPVE